jgi:hypothetical protein
MDDSEDKEFKVSLGHLAWAAIGIVLIWAVTGTVLYNWNPNENYGTFGDMFGAVNVLFSGLAFACLIFATFMQREELKLQRKELSLARLEAAATREEIKGQKEQAIAQNSTLLQEAFENTYFELLKLHVERARDCEIHHYSLMKGRQAFDTMFALAMAGYNNGQVKDLEPSSFSASFELQRPTIMPVLLPHIQNVTALLKFVSTSKVKDKKLYFDLLKAQLWNSEKKILMLYSVADLSDSSGLRHLFLETGLLEQTEMVGPAETTLKEIFEREL